MKEWTENEKNDMSMKVIENRKLLNDIFQI